MADFDPSSFKLGKLEAKEDDKTFRLAKYIDPAALPPAPATIHWDTEVPSWPMYLNNKIGDCTCAAMGHQVQLWTAVGGHPVTPTDNDVLSLYESVSGYDPKTGANDNGASLLDVLNHMRHDGLAGHKIGAFASIDVHNHALLKDGLYLFYGLNAGVMLPIAAQTMGTHWRKPRRTTGSGEPNSWGGHAIEIVAADRYGIIVVSWGELIRVDWAFVDEYFDEVWAIISPDFLIQGKSPEGFDTPSLTSDLSRLGKVA